MPLDQFSFIAKVLAGSLGLALLIKFVAPLLSIPATSLSALVAVLGVPLVMAIVLPRL